MANQQRIVHFHGTVQGVGFRYTACRVAGRHEVSGLVRNLPDGSVQCVVEGDAREIDRFLAELAQEMDGFIRRQTQQIAPYSGALAGFTVRY